MRKLNILEKAPAKLNLTLNVLGKRNDSYHEIEMITTTIDLSDQVELIPIDKNEIKVSLTTRFVPNDERNLAYIAAQHIKEKWNIKHGVHIKMKKSIPVSAGLGGGSSDAAAVLRGLNRLWDLQMTEAELAHLGIKIGSDVPFCVYSKTALVRGRGENIAFLNKPPSCWVVLAKPDIGVSTRFVFENLKLENMCKATTKNMIHAIKNKDFHSICKYTNNVLEPIILRSYPEVKRIKQKMIQLGALGVGMSGSGPTIYGLVKQEKKGKSIYNGLRGFCRNVYLVRMLG